MNRNRTVAAALGLVIAAGGVGWAAGSFITSPAEAAAQARPPEASLITVAVEQRVLSADVVARGSIDFDDPVALALSGPLGLAEEKQIVTMIPDQGTELAEGSIAVEVSGRPVILLEGDLPAYRDLRPGSSGADVLQLEESLKRLGLLDKADSDWDAATGAAVQALYAQSGYAANAESEEDQAQLSALRDEVRAATQAVNDASRSISDSSSGATSVVTESRHSVADAQAALAVAQQERSAAVTAAQGAVTVAEAAHVDAAAAATAVTAVRDQAVRANVHPDTGEVPTAAELSALDAEVATANLEATAAATALTDAKAAKTLVQTQQDAAVATAQRAVDLAKERLTEAQAPVDTGDLQRGKEDAQRQLADAAEALQKLEATTGTWVPSGEIIFVKRLPVQVARTDLARGDAIESTFMTVSGQDIAMTVSLTEAEAARIEVGDPVIVDEPDLLEAPIEAAVSEVPDPAGESGRVQVTVLLDSVPEELLGANVRVTIPVSSTDGEVLVVPAAALFAVANGDTRVEVEDPDEPGATEYVTVTTGLAADGVVEVQAVEGDLVAGARVVVGQAPSASDESSTTPTPGDDG
ncbi:hypothetical protein ON058_04385 [Demequina sp. B12]|uniref:hypothetical protein n=1 Tax=Demequina sp. B12 TaxID=2992757 RepID=UPI00237B68D2|nr:hypothetical protein [Demequina sp. B12]MDE0572650.1 hypothetical protein [Demequina sp. B12]